LPWSFCSYGFPNKNGIRGFLVPNGLKDSFVGAEKSLDANFVRKQKLGVFENLRAFAYSLYKDFLHSHKYLEVDWTIINFFEIMKYKKNLKYAKKSHIGQFFFVRVQSLICKLRRPKSSV
jgi:hypothetical protein